MARYVATAESPHPPDEVFDYLAHFESVADWDPGVTQATRHDEGPVAVGSAFDVTVRGVGAPLDLQYVVSDIDEGHSIVLDAETGALHSHDVITVEPAGDGSIVTYDATLELRGLAKLGGPILALGFRRIGDRAAAGLREALSAPHLGAA